MKSIFENTAPAYLHSSIYFLWLRWLGLWLMLLSVATGARLGQLAQERSPHPLKPGCRQWTKVRISLLSDHGALYTALYCTLYSDSSLTAASQLSSADPAAAWQGDTAVLHASHWYQSLIQTSHWPTCIFSFQNLMELCINAKSYKNRVQFQKNDTWKINGRQSEWTNSLINEMMCLLESITDKLFTLINMNGLKSYWTYQWSRFIFNVLNWWILIKNCSDNAICNTKYEMFNQVELTIIITPLPHKS